MRSDFGYWISIAHLSKWGYEKINDLIFKVYNETHSDLETFFSLEEKQWKSSYQLSEIQILDLLQAKIELSNQNVLVEELLSQGIEIVPINSSAYSKTLIANLGLKHAPPILYIKGNASLLQKESVAIVGSRNANEIALQFTDTIAKLAATESKVIVSGFAKGIDRQALESALKYGGQSSIVLPQGILTFTNNEYYQEIENGNLLLISTFPPKLDWSSAFANARNTIIYGLSNQIYVAQSNDKGGTWNGAMNGLKRGRTVFVRQTEPHEICANDLLIESGAIAVDLNGNLIDIKTELVEIDKNLSLEEQIITVLKNKPQTAQQLIDTLNLEWTTQKLSSLLKKMNFVKLVERTKPQIFRFCENQTNASLNFTNF